MDPTAHSNKEGKCQFLYLIVQYLILISTASAFCPKYCKCDDILLRVQCVNATLDVVPILLNPGTKELDLSHNNIKTILPGFAFYHELQFLNLSYNEILSLGKKNFASQSALRKLLVRGNKLSHILEKSFDGLKYLLDMDLSENYIEEIDESAFIFLENLIYMDLSNNKLSNLTTEVFLKLTKLKYLNLCNNNIQTIVPGVFDHLEGLEELSLCSNSISILEDSVFSNMGSLIHLSLYSNIISNLSNESFAGLNGLKYLDVHDNLLKDIPSQSFENIDRLEELHLGQNIFQAGSSKAFNNLNNLRTLHITRCSNLAILEPLVFHNLTNLFHLELTFNNKLSLLSKDILKPLVNLRNLILRGNSLRTLDRTSFQWLTLEYLDLRENNFDCNCSLKWLQELEMNKTSSLKLEDVFCASPEWSGQRNIIELSDYDLECYSEIFLVAACVAAIVILFLTLILGGFVYYKHCRKMKTLVHDHWPEKIVATWRDPEYEKQIEDDEYTFQSARSVSHIHIPVI